MRTVGKSFVLLAVLLLAWAAGAGAAGPAEQGRVLDDLHYGVDVMLFQDAVQARITLASLGGGRYRAELSGKAQGMAAILPEVRKQLELQMQSGRLARLSVGDMLAIVEGDDA